MKLTGAQILIRSLMEHGVDTIFGYPGGAVLDIYDELYKKSDSIKHVLCAAEQGASHAADGYARVTGKTGVVLATSGPGATNLVTGIANSYADSVPIVAITGNVATHLLGKDSFQEVDILGVTMPIVKHSYLVMNVEELEEIIDEAFRLANSGRFGPVLIDIPKDIQREECEYRSIAGKTEGVKFDIPDLTDAVDAIEKSKKPFIYVGGGAVSSGLSDEIKELAYKLDAPISTSIMGKTAVAASYERNLGPVGMHGTYASNMAQLESDLIIGIGVRFSDRATGNISEYMENRSFIHIDIDPSEFDKNVSGAVKLNGDAKKIVRALLSRLKQYEHREWMDYLTELKKRDELIEEKQTFVPENIIRCVNKRMSDEVIVATDVGQHQMWVMQYYRFEKPRRLLTSGGLGTMGYGLGAAIGGCIGSGGARTLLFTGDGSFGMNLNEMATAVANKLPIIVLVMNNRTLGMVRQWQSRFYEGRYSNTDLSARATDFVALAKAFGADGSRVSSLSELKAVLEEIKDRNEPYLIDLQIDMDNQVLPMIPPGKSPKDIIVN